MEVINTQNQPEDLNALNTGSFVQETPQKKTGFFKVLLIIFFVLLLSSTLFYFLFYKKDSVLEQETEQQETSVEQPEGEIYLTLSPVGTNKPNIYKFDVESMELEEYLPNEEENAKTMGKFSSDLSKMVYVQVNLDEVASIMVWDNELKEAVSIADFLEYFPRNPVFSSDSQSIFYWAFENKEGLDFAKNPEDNSIFNLGLDGSVEFVANGAFPVLTKNDEHLIYLKNDGLYALDLSSDQERLFFALNPVDLEVKTAGGVELPGWLSFRINYSSAKNLVALTDHSFGVRLLEINDWKESPTNVYKEFGVFDALWPIFSVNGESLVIQESVRGTEENIFSVFRIYDLQTLSWSKSYALDQFDSNYIWLTDWIIR